MLSVAKIHSQSKQARGKSAAGYLHYLGAAAARERGFEAYARGPGDGPAPFWIGGAPALLGLGDEAEREHVERMAQGMHPITGEPLVKGAGRSHVMGVDMTFSAPKDFSAVYAGADDATRAKLLVAMREATVATMAHAESVAVTRHGQGGLDKRPARAIAAAAYTHFASRALEPQLHQHVLALNLGLRGDGEWSALEQRGVFERKLSLGALWRADLAMRVAALGFEVEPDGPYFKIRDVHDFQREALSSRTREIDEKLRASGETGSAARRKAALSTRAGKAEPPLRELLSGFRDMADGLGLTPCAVAAMMRSAREPAPFAIDRDALLAEIMEAKSCATSFDALELICAKAMGRWTAAQCLAELDAFMRSDGLVPLGLSEQLAPVFTSKATQDLERSISERVAAGRLDASHAIPRGLVAEQFDALEAELSAKVGAPVSLAQQREAALAIACEPGSCRLVEGWAGSGKTTLLRATAKAWAAAGLSVHGCCQSASAAQNLSREADIPSRTIASLLLALQSGKASLSAKSVLVLDEAGLVGSREFGLLQDAAARAGAKMVCVGDGKQLQPIAAGGIFGALCRIHGKSEVSKIQRQRTDAEPMLAWLDGQARAGGSVEPAQVAALRRLSHDVQVEAIESLCVADPKLSKAFARWRDRYDHAWMRGVVERFAKGDALEALREIDGRGRLRLSEGRDASIDELISAWERDRVPVDAKLMVAARRADVAELNERARGSRVRSGAVDDSLGMDFPIKHRDGVADIRRMAPGDRIAFTKNDRGLGVANGVAGTLADIERREFGAVLRVELDEPNARGETTVRAPASFGFFDLAYATTGAKAQGRTVDSCHVLAGRSDRHWIYVAASRARYATTLYVDTEALRPIDPEAHHGQEAEPLSREEAIETLAASMARERLKVTTLEIEPHPRPLPVEARQPADSSRHAEASADLNRSAEPAPASRATQVERLSTSAKDLVARLARAFQAHRSRGREPSLEPRQRSR